MNRKPFGGKLSPWVALEHSGLVPGVALRRVGAGAETGHHDISMITFRYKISKNRQ